MKTLLKFVPLLFALALFSACSSDSDDNTDTPTRELVLSVKPNQAGVIITDQMDYEFEILDGNGGYTAKISEWNGDPDAKVTIDGNKVLVNILVRGIVEITIVDVKNNEKSFRLESTNETLVNLLGGHGINMDIGQASILSEATFFTFGVGAPYTIERMRGTASEATVVNGIPTIKALSQGVTHYKLRDRRGSVLPVNVTSGIINYELQEASKYLELEVKNNDFTTVKINWGDEWEIVKSKQTVVEDLSVGRPFQIGGTYADYYVLFIYTTDKGKGTDTITLEDKDGNFATVKVMVK